MKFIAVCDPPPKSMVKCIPNRNRQGFKIKYALLGIAFFKVCQSEYVFCHIYRKTQISPGEKSPGYGSVEREGYSRVGKIRASRIGRSGRAGRVRHSRAGRVRRVRASRVGRVRVRRLRTSRLGGAWRKIPATSGQSQSCVSSRHIHSNELC